jgi:single-strand DNA-binding protein
VKKGTQLHIEGRLTVRTYTDKEGKERFSLDVLAQDFTLLGSRTEGGENGAGNSVVTTTAITPATPALTPPHGYPRGNSFAAGR